MVCINVSASLATRVADTFLPLKKPYPSPAALEYQWVFRIWESDSLDWKGISAQEITQRVLSKVQPGSIVLFHNAAEHTPEALPGIIETLQVDGYTIVPISENIYAGDYTLTPPAHRSAPIRKPHSREPSGCAGGL